MCGVIRVFGRLGGLIALIFLIVALLRQLITLVGFLLVAIKIAIVVVFIALLVLIVLAILRDRSRKRREAWSFHLMSAICQCFTKYCEVCMTLLPCDRVRRLCSTGRMDFTSEVP